MRPPPTRSREWFRQQIAALGALVRTFPRRRQDALLEHLEDEDETESAPAGGTEDPPHAPRRPLRR
jgi:hypothetical protein